MAFAICVQLSEISCAGDSGESGALFAFAAKAGDGQEVVVFAPFRPGPRLLERPELPLFSRTADTPNVSLAILGFDLGRADGWEDSPLARQMAEARIRSALDLAPAGVEPGSPWDDGLEAIRDGIGPLFPRGHGDIIFDFSKVYCAPPTREAHTLFHTVGHRSGSVGSRYKIVLDIEGRAAGADRVLPTSPGTARDV